VVLIVIEIELQIVTSTQPIFHSAESLRIRKLPFRHDNFININP